MKWQTYFFKEVDSTNTRAVDYDVGSVIIAENQTAGRGRNGRRWQSLAGNLFLSAVLPALQNETPFLSFVAGVSLAEALPDVPVRLKWPNDVLLHHAKIAGILLERVDDKVIAGFGVNIRQAPDRDMLYQAGSLNQKYTPEEVTKNLLTVLSDNLDLLMQSGFTPIRQKWLNYAVGIGEEIEVKLPHETIRGLFETLTPQGAISLKTPTETRLISAGDIFLL